MTFAAQLAGAVATCVLVTGAARTQTADLHGQATGWIGAGHAEKSSAQSGLRYIPDLLLQEKLGGTLDANMELSLNAFATALYGVSAAPAYDAQAKPYRGWVRLSTDKFELRLGLQKINFGSAMFLRPLMWFDRVDPRDPLQLTDGVYAALARYYFLNNANIWAWGLYGNNDTKGWETVQTAKRTPEYGGRIQSPLGSGEIAPRIITGGRRQFSRRRISRARPAQSGKTGTRSTANGMRWQASGSRPS